jgi:hypothetical protein
MLRSRVFPAVSKVGRSNQEQLSYAAPNPIRLLRGHPSLSPSHGEREGPRIRSGLGGVCEEAGRQFCRHPEGAAAVLCGSDRRIRPPWQNQAGSFARRNTGDAQDDVALFTPQSSGLSFERSTVVIHGAVGIPSMTCCWQRARVLAYTQDDNGDSFHAPLGGGLDPPTESGTTFSSVVPRHR